MVASFSASREMSLRVQPVATCACIDLHRWSPCVNYPCLDWHCAGSVATRCNALGRVTARPVRLDHLLPLTDV